jgi:hypothetical protein
MANEWLRLWHDMPTDPKWRTIAKASGESIALVQSVYLHLLVTASRNVTRGHVDVTNEDLASALDVEESQILAVLDAMQGRVLDGDYLTGWEKRQPKKEDFGNDKTGAKSAAERKREERDRKKNSISFAEEKTQVTECHDESRNVTTDKDKDKDKDKDINNIVTFPSDEGAERKNCPAQKIVDLYHEVLPELAGVQILTEQRRTAITARWRQDKKHQSLEFWRKYFNYVRQSDFLMGRAEKTFFADIDFLMTASKFVRVIEGFYHAKAQ